MSLLFVLTFVLLVIQVKVGPRFAFAPLLIAACLLPHAEVVQVAGLVFTPAKLLIVAGLLRAYRERVLVWSSRHPLDVLVAVWACLAILSGFAHNPKDHNPVTIRLSLVYDIVGSYLYFRAFVRSREDAYRLCKCLVLSMIPLAILMLAEKSTAQSPYGVFGDYLVEAEVREGKVRAQGPFSHAILAGTAGAVALPLAVLLWRKHSRLSLAGICAGLIVVVCSGSSGPIVTLMAGLTALFIWRWRISLPWIKAMVVVGVIALHVAMNHPVWYLMGRFDLTGGSTGWHRAELITQALKNLGDWWLIGTDYTRHWMPYGVNWSGDQADITNYYLRMGVTGGLALMFLFIAILTVCFRLLGRRMIRFRREGCGNSDEFALWCVGATLFAHCVTFLSVSYFDQSFVFLCLAIGVVPGICAQPIVYRRNSLPTEIAVETSATPEMTIQPAAR